jgi:polysaccharide biosynthesis/export protein
MRGMEDMKRIAAVLLTVWAALFSASALAQNGVQNGVYRLQPLDVIRIQVYNEPQINAALQIGRDGNVSPPFLNIIRAAGKTTDELAAELEVQYRDRLRLRDPRVSVTIELFRPIRASIGGAVRQPGLYDFRPGDTILSLINRGGGAVTDTADLRRAYLRRGDSPELIPIDLHSMLLRGDMTQNYELEDGDDLTVPEETRNRLLILGALARPGPYPYREPMFLADAITMAGGPIPIRSKLSQVWIMRERPGRPGDYQRIEANFVRFVAQNDNSQNVQLMPGDFIYVNETRTPNFNEIGAVLNSFFILDRLFRDGVFGFRLFR